MIKTLYIARKSMMTGNDNMALLSYNEVASLFKKGDHSKNLAICYNNIGCIHLKKKDFKT